MKKWTKVLLAEILLVLILYSYNNVIFISFIWIICHELVHIIVAKYFGCKFNNIEIHIFGAKAEFGNFDELQDGKKIMIYLSGPLFNVIMSIILLWSNINNQFFIVSIGMNMGLAIFNMLPAYPLDGSRIYEILLSKHILYKKAQRILIICSYMIAIIFCGLSLLMFIFLHKFNISMIISGIIIVMITYSESKGSMYILMGNIVKKRNIFNSNKYIENKNISLHYKLGLVNALGIVDKNKFNMFYVLNDDMKLLYILYEDELVEALKIYGNITLEEYYMERSIETV